MCPTIYIKLANILPYMQLRRPPKNQSSETMLSYQLSRNFQLLGNKPSNAYQAIRQCEHFDFSTHFVVVSSSASCSVDSLLQNVYQYNKQILLSCVFQQYLHLHTYYLHCMSLSRRQLVIFGQQHVWQEMPTSLVGWIKDLKIALTEFFHFNIQSRLRTPGSSNSRVNALVCNEVFIVVFVDQGSLLLY